MNQPVAAPRTRTGRVFIVQDDPNKNLLSASEFGELQRPVFEHDQQVVMNSAPMVRELKTALRDFSDDDFILAVGDWVLVGIACAVAANVNGGRFRILKWDRETRQYYAVLVQL